MYDSQEYILYKALFLLNINLYILLYRTADYQLKPYFPAHKGKRKMEYSKTIYSLRPIKWTSGTARDVVFFHDFVNICGISFINMIPTTI